jgi:hypothetical protein
VVYTCDLDPQILDVALSMRADYGRDRQPRYPLPGQPGQPGYVSRASIGLKLQRRMHLRNYLCPFTYNIQWERQRLWNGNPATVPSLFSRVLVQELGANGPMQRGDLLNPLFTGLPSVI